MHRDQTPYTRTAMHGVDTVLGDTLSNLGKNSDKRWHQQYHGLPTNYRPQGSYPPPQYALPPPIKIPAFDGKTEWETWIVRFETRMVRG